MTSYNKPGTYVNPGGRTGPKTKTSRRTVTNTDGTRTITTTTEVTTTTAFKEETTKKIDTQHLPSLPRIRRDKVELEDGTTGWKKVSTVVHPSGQREITTEWPDGEKEVKIEEGPKGVAAGEILVESIPKEHKKEMPSWPSYPWDSAMKRLKHHADVVPHKTAIAFLQASENNVPTISSSITYQKLDMAVEYLASRLLPPDDGGEPDPKKALLVSVPKDQPALSKGDRILLVYPPCSSHFILAFLACLRAGLVAVPVYPPHPERKDSVSAFVRIARGCGARVALTNGDYAQAKRLAKMKSSFMSILKKRSAAEGVGNALTWPEELIWVVTDREPLQNPPTNFPKSELSPEPHEMAFIQYTSGSTSSPKGVTLTHANLAHNLFIITDDLGASHETNVVSWLPQYHDMGLIGSLIGVLYCGGSGYYMSPIAFLQRPVGWLEAVSEYRGTHLQAPNFAFGLTARKFEPEKYYHGLGGVTLNEDGRQVKPLDLSCLKHVVNGAEPVTEKSMGAFFRAFSPFGLPDGVIYPTYGLAEHTVFVCSGGKGKIAVKKKNLEEENRIVIVDEMGESEKSEGTVCFLGCGFPTNQNVDVRIVDPVRRVALPDGIVGEIWINSPSKALGYFGVGMKETKMDFHALLDNMKDTSMKFGGYLRSGDLGFLHGNQLYICGRIKDLIIVGGRNHYPQDIEATAEDVASEYVRPGCSASFSIGHKSNKGDYEEVVLAMELKAPLPRLSEYENIVDMVRAEIFSEHSLSLSCIVLVRPKTMPKTTSGKIQRSKAQKGFVARTLEEVYRKDFLIGDVADFSHTAEAREVKQESEPTSQTKDLTPNAIRALEKPAIRKMLLDVISRLANIDVSSITDGAALNSLMDSVTLAQLKGLLEEQYAVKPMSDAYLFNDSTTVNKLVEVVKAGEARDDTGEGGSGTASGGGGGPGCCGCIVM